ncbi:hypothetical protein C8F04DRAFT_1177591 [Mycena alexandri]|uniref:Uncharacterized protein n=1 Tax=Mycena alexandri TaxID=1745969 RepID=A0AAD6T8V2_9AGAR|nr:hypothetical protein C8F04DRAFT_1177591 [Mycena alexandri]
MVGHLLGDPKWAQKFIGDATSGGRTKDVSSFLECLSKAQKLDDVPAEIYELRQQGAAPLRPSPIELRWETIESATHYFLSPKVRPLKGMQKFVVIRSAAAAIEVLRRNWATIEEVALNLVARGIPFNTFSPGPLPALPPADKVKQPYKGLGFRHAGFQATPSEYAKYESIRNRIFCSERGRVALMMGGVIARLALGVVNPQAVCSGPSSGAYTNGRFIWDGRSTSPAYVDDVFTQEELDIICGVYEVSTGQSDPFGPDGQQTKTVSWWPREVTWRNSGLNMGYWTRSCEAWFQNRLAEIRAGSAELHNLRHWNEILPSSDRCRLLSRTNDGLAAAFLDENGTRIVADPTTETFPRTIGGQDPSLRRFYFTLRTHRPDSPSTLVVDETLKSKSSSKIATNTLKPEVQNLTRQYWEARRKITTLSLRGAAIENRLRSLKVKDPDIYGATAELTRRLVSTESELAEERKRSRKAENILQDIQRECETPNVVPMLVAALGEN